VPENIHFDNPPLNEVVCGLHFSGINWAVIDFGLFYSQDKSKFLNITSQPPLPDPNTPIGKITIVEEFEIPRVWYEYKKDPSYLIQVQKDRFILNWRKRADNEYPHFPNLYERFSKEWKGYKKYCSENDRGTPSVKSFELSYINHLGKGEGLSSAKDLATYFKDLDFLKDFNEQTTFGLNINYNLEEFPLRTSWKGARTKDNQDIFILEFRIIKAISGEDQLDNDMKKANELLAKEFKFRTTEQAHEKWGLKK